ncbi:Sulfur globule protein CV2 domain protein [Trichostrongylus colubriformis]|uniref:Sulfur globule protein CV2 domain protein n=1 Tax=Trichostrongylus colubriformis TaxID=6319 RepID=A0AAN8FEU4_TRICO
MNTFTLLLLCVAVVGVWGAVREKRQQRTVIQRTVVSNYGGQGFNRQPPYGGFGNSWNANPWGAGFNRGPFVGQFNQEHSLLDAKEAIWH